MTSIQKALDVNQRIKDKKYPVQELSTAQLIECKRIQVKGVASVSNDVVRQITERYNEDLFSPVTVIIDDSMNVLMLVDGNHRVHAKAMLNHPFTPAYVVPYKDLDNDEHNAYYLGCARQVNPLVAKELNDNDIKNLIIKDIRAGIKVQTEEYYDGLAGITDRPLQSVRMSVSAIIHTIGGPKRPWSKVEAANYTVQTYSDMINHCCSIKEYTRGVGTVIEAMAQNSTTECALVLYHPRTDSISNYHHVSSTIDTINKAMGINIQVEVLGLKDNEEYANG